MSTALQSFPLTESALAAYRRDGFLATPGLLTAAESEDFRQRFLAAAAKSESRTRSYGKGVFDQYVNLWQGADPTLLHLAQHPALGAVATALAGQPLRLWHDHLLVKAPHNGVATEFHQDLPYWPHQDGEHTLSAWVALVDIPPERGCMSYLPGSHRRTGLPPQNLGDPRSLFAQAPDLEWEPFVTVPVRAGDVIWHHARTAHRANANATEVARVAVSIIYMPRTTRFNGKGHVCTQGKGLTPGDLLEGADFPDISG